MKTLLVRDGDLVVGQAGHEAIQGAAKVHQDLRHALAEPLGSDSFHPEWGSQVERFVGGILDPSATLDVRAEVARVIQNYVAGQREQMQRDRLYDRRSRFATDGVVSDIEDIRVSSRGDRVDVRVVLRTLANQPILLETTVG